MYNNPFEDFGPSERRFPGGQFPGGPPGGPFPPGGTPGGGFGPPFGPPGQNQPPGPPPNFVPAVPAAQAQAFAGGGMNRCLFRNTYVWLRNGRSFWFYPIAVTRDNIIGFRWSNRRGWVFSTIRRNSILTFTCVFF